MVVDDDAGVRRLLARELGERFEVISADGVDSALELLASTDGVVAVVSDWHLGRGRTGLDLLAEVRESYPNAVRVLASGTLPSDMSRSSLHEHTLDEFVAKPWQPGDMLAAVIGALEARGG